MKAPNVHDVGRSTRESYGSGRSCGTFKPTIFLAEDDEAMRNLLAAAMRRDGFEVVELDDGRALWAELILARDRDDAPAMVVTDVRMPGASGLEILREIRGWGWSIPFLLITAFANGQTRIEAANGGATAVFSKPFDVDDLRTAVGWFLPRKSSSAR